MLLMKWSSVNEVKHETELGIVFQINVKPETPGERGIPKHATPKVHVTANGLAGDFNRWRHEKAQDDPAMAILILPLETIEELNREGWAIKPGDLGENFTTQGIPYNSFAPGKLYRVGDAEIQITKPCAPCNFLFSLPNMGENETIVKTLHNRRGWYARTEMQGWVVKGDTISELPTSQNKNHSPS